ncbi:MAG TPA: class I SAM-dependent methyltransferase [Actinomycetota bacterium]
MTDHPGALPCDYDARPDRFRQGRDLIRRAGGGDGVHRQVADRFHSEGLRCVLDLGCGDGTLLRLLSRSRLTVRTVGLDRAWALLRDAPAPVVRGDAAALPFHDAAFDGAAALFMLYHLPDPTLALREAHRVLRAGGLFAAAAPSRDDSPELACFLPPAAPVSFDAEVAADLLGGVFEEVEVQRWNLPLRLPDRPTVRDYLVGMFLASGGLAERVAARVEAPLVVTKRGALCFARKAGP